MNKVTVSKAAYLLKNNDDILIITHRRPDGDTTGCAGALCSGLRQLGKTAYVLENPDITKRYAPLVQPFAPKSDWTPKFIVTVDVADESLFTENAKKYIGDIDLVIDHHPSNPGIGKVNLIRPEAGACAEAVYDVLLEMGIELTKEIAYCLYIALSTDTGCFKFSNTTPHTLRAAAACLESGIDGGEINRAIFEIKSWARFQMERIIFDTMEFYHDKNIAIVCLYRKDIDKVGADADDLDSIASLTRQIEGVQVGITLTENKDMSIKASVRTTKEVDASAICAKCGGGGHMRAAGASFDKSVDMSKAHELILQAALSAYEG